MLEFHKRCISDPVNCHIVCFMRGICLFFVHKYLLDAVPALNCLYNQLKFQLFGFIILFSLVDWVLGVCEGGWAGGKKRKGFKRIKFQF